MSNADLIARLRQYVADHTLRGGGDTLLLILALDAADALEAAEARIKELEDGPEGTFGVMLRRMKDRAEAAEAAAAALEQNRATLQRHFDECTVRAEAAEAEVASKSEWIAKQQMDIVILGQMAGRAEAAEAEVARLREALERIARSNVHDFSTLHPDACRDVARAALEKKP